VLVESESLLPLTPLYSEKYLQYETLKRGYGTKFDHHNPAEKYDRIVPGGSKSPLKK